MRWVTIFSFLVAPRAHAKVARGNGNVQSVINILLT
jgi:hypothetical protein